MLYFAVGYSHIFVFSVLEICIAVRNTCRVRRLRMLRLKNVISWIVDFLACMRAKLHFRQHFVVSVSVHQNYKNGIPTCSSF